MEQEGSGGVLAASGTGLSFSDAFASLKAAIQTDPTYAWAWFCNLSVPITDATALSSAEADQAAALIMCQMFDTDITAHPEFSGEKSAYQSYFEMRVEADRTDAPVSHD